MKHLSRTLFALTAIALASAAQATCTDGTMPEAHPGGNCNTPITTTTTTPGGAAPANYTGGASSATATSSPRADSGSTAIAGGGEGGTGGAGGTAQQGQRQGQGQGQGQRQQSTSSAAGAGANAGAGAGAYSGSNSVTIQGAQAGSGDRYLSVALPPAPPAMAPTMVGGAVSSTAMRCGPAQRIEAQPIYGRQFGIFKDTDVLLGSTETTQPYLDENGQPAMYIAHAGRWFGHEVLYSTAVLGVTGATSVGVGGFGSNGGGNAGGGVSGGMQRMVTTIQLRLCDVAAFAAPPEAARRLQATTTPAKPRRARQRPPARPVAAVADKCMSDAAASCKAPATQIKLN